MNEQTLYLDSLQLNRIEVKLQEVIFLLDEHNKLFRELIELKKQNRDVLDVFLAQFTDLFGLYVESLKKGGKNDSSF